MADTVGAGTGESGRIGIVAATDGHAEAMAAFFRAVWTPSATAESVLAARASSAAQNRVAPGTPPPTWLATRGNEVIGYVTTIPVRFWDGLTEVPGHWLKGLMVLPEFRNGPIGHAVLKAASQALERSGGLAAAPPARRLFSALGYTDLGAIQNLVRPLALGRMLRQLARGGADGVPTPAWASRLLVIGRLPLLPEAFGGLAGLVLRLRAMVGRLGSGMIAVAVGEPPPASELDDLWSRFRRSTGSATVRDGRYLLDRYPTGPGTGYTWVTARRSGRLVGVAILRKPGASTDSRLQGLRIATLVDLVDDPADAPAIAALVHGTEGQARELAADALLASASAPRLQRALRRQCYFAIGGNVHLLLRPAPGDGGFARDLRDWWLTRGDGQADDAL